MSLNPNRLILTGENPFIRLSDTDGGAITTNASFWRILISPTGAGHVLYLRSDRTGHAKPCGRGRTSDRPRRHPLTARSIPAAPVPPPWSKP
jgi:hypothetical protein